jgi:hypothetical protein
VINTELISVAKTGLCVFINSDCFVRNKHIQ